MDTDPEILKASPMISIRIPAYNQAVVSPAPSAIRDAMTLSSNDPVTP